MKQRFVYADNAATTRISEHVLNEMIPFLKDHYGNPSSIYSVGREAKVALEEARGKVAKALNADPNEIYFTAGGSEADNWAIRSIAELMAKKGKNTSSPQILSIMRYFTPCSHCKIRDLKSPIFLSMKRG